MFLVYFFFIFPYFKILHPSIGIEPFPIKRGDDVIELNYNHKGHGVLVDPQIPVIGTFISVK